MLSKSFDVTYAQFSVMPYASNIGTPKAIKNFNTSGDIGAAPEIAMAILLNPNFFFSVLKDNICAIKSNIRAIKSLNDLFKRLSVAIFPSFNEKLNISLLKNVASLIFTRLVEYILSHILGTAGKKSG